MNKTRIIKFRIWFRTENKYAYHQIGNDNYIGVELHSIMNYPNSTIIQEFAGLQDKNGKDIYEGDIFCWEGRQMEGEILYRNGQFICDSGGYEELLGVHEPIEIIGNIFENPNLI